MKNSETQPREIFQSFSNVQKVTGKLREKFLPKVCNF